MVTVGVAVTFTVTVEVTVWVTVMDTVTVEATVGITIPDIGMVTEDQAGA